MPASLCCPFKLKSRRLMSSLQSPETPRGIRSCRSRENGAAPQPQLTLAVLGLCAPSQGEPPKGTKDCQALEIKGPR